MTVPPGRPLRCRLGLRHWDDVARPDDEYVRTCRAGREERGPFAQYEQRDPRSDARSDHPVTGSGPGL